MLTQVATPSRWKSSTPAKYCGAAAAVAERHAWAAGAHHRRLTIAMRAEILPGERQHGGLPNAAGHHQQMLGGRGRETVSQRSPHVQRHSPPPAASRRVIGPMASTQCPRLWPSGRVRHHVVQRQRTTQERIVLAGQSQHHELARQDMSGQFRTGETQPIRILGNAQFSSTVTLAWQRERGAGQLQFGPLMGIGLTCLWQS